MILLLYYILVVACFITSLVVFKYNKGIKVFPWLMGITIIVDGIAYVLSHIYVISPYGLYHFYIPIEGVLMSYFFYHSIEEAIAKKIIVVAGALFVISSFSLTFFFYRLTDFPGLVLNLQGFLLISLSLYTLLTLEPVHNVSIFKHPLAWISIGIIVFYTGTFFFNGIHNYLVATKSKNRGLIQAVVNNGLNCFMYLSFMAGLIFSHRLKKYEQSAVSAK